MAASAELGRICVHVCVCVYVWIKEEEIVINPVWTQSQVEPSRVVALAYEDSEITNEDAQDFSS